MVPCGDVTQPRLHPDQQHDAEHGCSGLRAAYTSFPWGTLFSNIFILRRELTYTTNRVHQKVLISWETKTKPHMDDFYGKRFQLAPYLWLYIPALWFLISHNGECFRERLFELYKPPAHTHMQNNNNSLKMVNSVTCPSLVIPFICASPLSAHRFPILFSRR